MSEAARGPIALLREIQQKTLSPKLLSKDDRRLCVEHLTGEGCSLAEIAEILQVTLRTVQRDMARIREDHALTAGSEVTSQLIGQLVLHAQQAIARFRRIARDKSVQPATQVQAEMDAWQVQKDLIKQLQSLGILPTAVQELRADIRHLVTETQNVGEMRKELSIIEHALIAEGGAPELLADTQSLKRLLEEPLASAPASDAPDAEASVVEE